VAPERLVLQSADVEFPAHHRAEQSFVAGIEKIEPRIGTILVLDGAGQLVELVPAGARIGDGGEEFQIPAIGRFQQFAQRRQAVDGLLHRRPLDLLGAVAVFYLAVVLEKGQIVDRGLDPQNEPELVVELQRYRTHGVLDPRACDADVEPVGRVIAADVASGPAVLRRVAQYAIKRWRYEPTLLNGKPIERAVQVDVRFVLSQ
jgi:hypothetical protein